MPEILTDSMRLGSGEIAEFTFTNPAQLNQFWGSIVSQMGQVGIMGEHSKEAGVFTPNAGDGGRTGVGNSSNDDPRFNTFLNPDATLADGAQGFHAIFQGSRFGDPRLPDSPERDIEAIYPTAHGQVTFDILI